MLTQRRMLNTSVSNVQLTKDEVHLTENESSRGPAIFVQQLETEVPKQRVDSYDLLMHQMMTLTKPVVSGSKSQH